MKAVQFVNELPKLDPKILSKFQRCKSPEEAYAVAKANGLDDTLKNFSAAMQKLNEKAAALNEDELDAVAGGSDTTEIVSAVSSTVAAATAGASAAASAAAV